MKSLFIFILSLVGLIGGAIISLGAYADLSNLVSYLNDYVHNPITFLIVFAVVISLSSFFKKFIADAYKWFTT